MRFFNVWCQRSILPCVWGYPQLHLDFAGRSRLRQNMDNDAADLITKRCTHTGMSMEDMSLLALTTGSISGMAEPWRWCGWR